LEQKKKSGGRKIKSNFFGFFLFSPFLLFRRVLFKVECPFARLHARASRVTG
jgi:hypothetical protein